MQQRKKSIRSCCPGNRKHSTQLQHNTQKNSQENNQDTTTQKGRTHRTIQHGNNRLKKLNKNTKKPQQKKSRHVHIQEKW